MRILVLAFSFKTQYHVLRCITQNGAEVHVLGKHLAKGLTYSRFCSSYNEFQYDPRTTNLLSAAQEINDLINELDIDYVMPSDIISTKLLICLKNDLSTKLPLLPDIETFNILNDKWSFYHFCCDLGLPVPKTYCLPDISSIISAVNKNNLPLPLILKPTDMMGGADIHILRNQSDFSKITSLKSKSILAQEYISGPDCGISMVCKDGEVICSCFQKHYSWGYEFENKPMLNEYLKSIALKTNYNGIAHFDLIEIEEDKKYVFLECNPRSWYSAYALMLAGLNYPILSMNNYDNYKNEKLGMKEKILISVNKHVFRKLFNPFSLSHSDWITMMYYLSDPIPFFLERFSFYDDQALSGEGSLIDQVNYLNAIQ